MERPRQPLAMTGHNPHRPEGKAMDAERQSTQRKHLHTDDPQLPAGDAPEPSRYDAEEQIGGSRPGVPSKVKEAIENRDDPEEG